MLIPISNLEEAVVKNMLNQFLKVKEKSRISYLLILVFIAWFIHKWIFSFSNWFPISLLLFASTQVSTSLSLFMLLNQYSNWSFGNKPIDNLEFYQVSVCQFNLVPHTYEITTYESQTLVGLGVSRCLVCINVWHWKIWLHWIMSYFQIIMCHVVSGVRAS
jgi:hypothetical protein